MTEFKQIIGRGTRINEEYGKRYFTILDFRNVTDLFADPDFDGDPVRIKEVSPDTNIGSIEDEEVENPEIVLDEETGEEVTNFEDNSAEALDLKYPERNGLSTAAPPIVREHREKVFVNGIDVSILNERQMYFDQEGKPITMSLKDYTRQQCWANTRPWTTSSKNGMNQTARRQLSKELEETRSSC